MKAPDILKLMSAITMTSTTYSRNSSAFERKNSTEFGKQEWIPENDDMENIFFEGFFDPKADVVPLVLALLIVFINTFVVVLIFRKKYLRTNTNLLLWSLAMSDLLTGVVSVPLFITCNIIRQSAICIMEEQMSRFISASTVCHLMSVTMDRYLAIMHPLRYSSIVTRSNCILVILSIWLISPIVALVQLSWLIPYHQHVEAEPSVVTLQAESIYDAVFLSLFFLFPMVFMSFTYAKIILEIVRQSRNIHQNHHPTFSNATRSRIRHERKAFAIFAAMLLTYMICWLPYFSIRRFEYSGLPIPLIYVIFWLRYLASLLNPCFYIFGKQDFRKAVCDNQVKLDV